jgi:hypothetical protein
MTSTTYYAWWAVAVVLATTSTIAPPTFTVTVDAFAMPRLRTKMVHKTLTAGDKARTQLEFERRDSSSNSNKNHTLHAKEVLRNGRKAPPAGSPLDMICEEEESYEIHVGRALDTLRRDYPHILTDQPGKAQTGASLLAKQ